ncbi:hypothetical protein LPTSP4_26220 [Leptospira ryugenii]|uniref:Uncharacterized protein n=1 Tax=Leptospira ryugenii TaxID=1917863 RepID=A0A2P2E2J2_9LEPT|nr:hypothetical protein [Leptospira ryugenii]GBF51091.1 hypothetical protein LPTSP4_26220 [Leptospira ryugenii]
MSLPKDSAYDFHIAFQSSFREFFGTENELGWELYSLQSEESANENWMAFTIRNPLAGRSLVFRFLPNQNEFYAFLKVQVIPGEENWNLDTLFKERGYSKESANHLLSSTGVWKFHAIARHYFGIIISFCPRILEPDFQLY